MWSISNTENSVVLTKKQAIELSKVEQLINVIYGYYTPENISEDKLLSNLFDIDKHGNYRLNFLEDHMEHMDYLCTNENIMNKLKELKIKGDITFGSLEGDNRNCFWGYRFDGQGGMQRLTGKIVFEVASS